MESKMGMDRNTIIGFVLLGVLLFTYLFTATKNNQQLERQRLREADSVAAIKKQQEALHVTHLYVDEPKVEKSADGTQTITYALPAPSVLSLLHQYVMRPDSYLVDWNLTSTGANQLFSQNNLNINWHSEMEKTQTYVYYE